MSIRFSAILLALALASGWPGTAAAQPTAGSDRCAALARTDFGSVQDAPTAIISSETVTNGTEQLCRIMGNIAPAVGFELSLPLKAGSWNGHFVALGCGGFCGETSDFYGCPLAVKRGYACIITDMGHKGTPYQGVWAYNNPQAEIDFGYRATHVTALAGKAIVARFYGIAARKSYFVGCSTGGRQGLVSAQRFPWDFDGIVAGAPIIDLTGATTQIVWNVRANLDANGAAILPVAKLALVHRAVLAACGSKGIVADPRRCGFDPARLRCTRGDAADCLSDAQIRVVNDFYSGARTSAGKAIGPFGLERGSELNWAGPYVADDGPGQAYALAAENFRYADLMPDPGPGWSPRDFDFDMDPKRIGMMEALYSGTNPDLRRFRDAGGKLIVYQGWNDVFVPPRAIIDYYDTATTTMGGSTAMARFARLFMLPAANHCTGGHGGWAVDWLAKISAWVERGEAPDRIIAQQPGGVVHYLGLDLEPAKGDDPAILPYRMTASDRSQP